MVTFIAGHNGMVGSAVARKAPSHEKIVVSNRSDLDLRDVEKVKFFLEKHRVSSVVLAAAKVGGIKANNENQKSFLYENLSIQNAVMMAADQAGVQNFIFLGSSCVYPRYASQPIGESELLTGSLEATNEAYAIAKIAGIRLCKAIYEESSRNFFSLMPTNLYGENDNFDLDSSHVPAALMRRFHEAKLQNLEAVEVWGSGKVLREFMHVDDLADAIWYLLTKELGGELINIGTGQDLSIRDFALLMASVIDFNGKILFNSEKPEGTPRKLLDVHKVNELGWHSQIELQDGLAQTYSWFQEALLKGKVRGY
jgi:GDP-L-fucose synthase